MSGTRHTHHSSGDTGPDGSDTDADQPWPARTPGRAPEPAWLRQSDLDALAQRFAPVDAAQARHLALLLAEGSTPVELLILRLVGAGLSHAAARQFIAELRALRERPRQPTSSGPAKPGSDVAAALDAAARSYLLEPGNDERAARAIARRVQWSVVRARWFLSVNRDELRRLAEDLARDRPADA